jgi:hypothetical protein
MQVPEAWWIKPVKFRRIAYTGDRRICGFGPLSWK